MADDFIILERGFFEGTMKMISISAKTLFAAMLFHADPDGMVRGKSIEHWASYLSYPPVDLKSIEDALAELEAPDPDSTTPDEGGRRIVRDENQRNTWRIVNYPLYRQKKRAQLKRQQEAIASQKYRDKQKALGVEVPEPRRRAKPADAPSASNGSAPKGWWEVLGLDRDASWPKIEKAWNARKRDDNCPAHIEAAFNEAKTEKVKEVQ